MLKPTAQAHTKQCTNSITYKLECTHPSSSIPINSGLSIMIITQTFYIMISWLTLSSSSVAGEIKGFLTLLDLWTSEAQTLHLEEGEDTSRFLKHLKLHFCRKCELAGATEVAGFSAGIWREVCSLDIGLLLTVNL